MASKRPKSLIIITSWLIIIGVIGVAGQAILPQQRDMVLHLPTVFQRVVAARGATGGGELFVELLSPLVCLISGIGLLAGFNWARWLYIAFSGACMLLAWFLYPDASPIAKFLVFGVWFLFAYFLTRPDVSMFLQDRSGGAS